MPPPAEVEWDPEALGQVSRRRRRFIDDTWHDSRLAVTRVLRQRMHPCSFAIMLLMLILCSYRGSVQALLNDESHSDWSAITNLDAFFCKVYTYYVEKGFWCMIAARITNLLSVEQSRERDRWLVALESCTADAQRGQNSPVFACLPL
jgi:hypothetical protein